jgi:hypothetical protein
VVIGPNIDKTVHYAGGWLFDRVMAGWDVTAVVADPRDIRPLRILGATVVDMDAAMAVPVRGPVPQTIAIDTALYESDSRVRTGLEGVLDQGVADVRMWGEHWPTGIDPRFGVVQHQLSLAAKAFKARAMAATSGSAGDVNGTEVFRCTELLAPPSKTA